jgi:single-strand DNA-binding protein
MSTVNRVILVGNLGKDPEMRTTQSGAKIGNISLATSETWKDKGTGEKKEKTEWHRVVIFDTQLADICERYLKKGSKIYIEGSLQTRSWEKDGETKYTTEVVLQRFSSKLVMLGEKGGNNAPSNFNDGPADASGTDENPLEGDDIPW